MSSLRGFEFVETIESWFGYAAAVQQMTLQDAETGGFKKPLRLADPDSITKVIDQQQRLRDHPERYCGYTRDGELVAYMKQNDWLVGDELPFAPWPRAIVLRAGRALGRSNSTGQWGVLGLVASNHLSRDKRESVLTDLLQRSFRDSRGRPRTVNIVIHAHDPLLYIAPRYGFVPVGRPGQAAGAPGLKQQRYQRLASH